MAGVAAVLERIGMQGDQPHPALRAQKRSQLCIPELGAAAGTGHVYPWQDRGEGGEVALVSLEVVPPGPAVDVDARGILVPGKAAVELGLVAELQRLDCLAADPADERLALV